MRFLSSRFTAATLLAGAALSFSPETSAAQAQTASVKGVNSQPKKAAFHASQKTLEALGNLKDGMIDVAGPDAAHIIVVFPSDVLDDKDREKIARFQNDLTVNPLPQIDGTSRIISYIKSVGNDYPKGYVASFEHRPKAHLNTLFGYLASGSPHAVLERGPNGNVCFITGIDPDFSVSKLLGMMAGIKSIELQHAGSARPFYEIVMRHEAQHCRHDFSKDGKNKWRNALGVLPNEIDADKASFSSFGARAVDDAEIAQAIRLYTHARNVGVIRSIAPGTMLRDPANHAASSLTGQDGKPVSPRNVILASALLNNLLASVNGMALGQPEAIFSPHPTMVAIVSQVPGVRKMSQQQILKFVQENYIQFGEKLNALDPVVEYAAMKFIEEKLLDTSAGKSLLPFEDAMIRMARGYIEGMEALNPTLKTHPKVSMHTERLKSFPVKFWEDSCDILSHPLFDELEKTGKEPDDRLFQVIDAVSGKAPTRQRAALDAGGPHLHRH